MNRLKSRSWALLLLTGFATAALAEAMKPERAMPPRPGSMVPDPKPCGLQKEGKVKEYAESKGQGTVTGTENAKEISFEKSGLVDQVSTGDSVCFDIAGGQKGPRAVNIRKRTVRPQHIPVPPT